VLEKLNLRMEYKIGTDARCAVIGYGSWATAIVGLLAANGRRVGWYVRNPEVLESLCSDGRNPRYLNYLSSTATASPPLPTSTPWCATPTS